MIIKGSTLHQKKSHHSIRNTKTAPLDTSCIWLL